MPAIKKAGAGLIAVSPMLTRYSQQLVNKLGIEFPLLSDQDSRVMAQCGVLFRLPDELIRIYRGFGIDLERFNGESSWRLPLPGRIIIDKQGTVRDVELSTDHTERPEPVESLELLEAL